MQTLKWDFHNSLLNIASADFQSETWKGTIREKFYVSVNIIIGSVK